MPFPVTKDIAEGDLTETIGTLLDTVIFQNRGCNVLTGFKIEGLGTTEAKVVMTFDGDKCEKKKKKPATSGTPGAT